MLNGGIILTGGGSQLKHLLQLTEYVTGLNARIGFPNEHLSGGHIEELSKPMYSTCIGLILKGYNDYENKNKSFDSNFIKVASTGILQEEPVDEVEVPTEFNEFIQQNEPQLAKRKKTIKGFMDSFKTNLIEMFKEEGDEEL
jgi:cell division protein FtsA